MRGVLLLILCVSTGCVPTRPSGICVETPSDPRCGALDGGPDSGLDAARVDAGLDAGVDAGPCGGRCTGTARVCLEATDECVECALDDDCAGEDRCDLTAHECVACLTNADCTDTTASVCGPAHLCEACTGDADCTHLTATPVCDEGGATCVACTTDTEAVRCGANSCRASDGTCTSTARNTRDTCDECEADSECLTGRRCVRHLFSGTDLGGFCLLDASMGGCGDTDITRRPYSTRTELTSVDGVTATYCMPPVTTTCQGIRDTRSRPCTVDDDCGASTLTDAYCPTGGTGAGACSYRCGGAFDCADPLTCGGTPQHCRP